MGHHRKRDLFILGIFAWLRLNAIEKLRSCVGYLSLGHLSFDVSRWVMTKTFILIASVLALSSLAWTQSTKDAAAEYGKAILTAKESARQLSAAADQLVTSNREISANLAKLNTFDVQKWASAFLNHISVIKIEEAEKKFQKSQNEVERILAASLIQTQAIVSKNHQTEMVKRAVAYMKSEVEPALSLFLSSMSSQEKAFAVKDNPLAFGNEVDALLNKKFDDISCTKEVFDRSLDGILSSDKKKNIVLFLSPYMIYQSKYLLPYYKRLLDLAKKWKHPKSVLVQNFLTARLIQGNSRELMEINKTLLAQHEGQMRSVLGPEFTSYQIEGFEREIVRRVPSCFGNGMMPASPKVRKFILGR